MLNSNELDKSRRDFKRLLFQIGDTDKKCSCSAKVAALQQQTELLNNELYPMTVSLGALKTENTELKAQVQ